jgi:ketosteroid isomerase-like protein
MKKLSILLKQAIVLFALCISAIGFQSCNENQKEKEPSVPEFNLTTAKAEIEEANKNFMALVAAGDSIGLANAYTKDAKFMSAGAPSVVGRANIQTAMSNIIKSGITGVDLRLENIYGTEDLIAEEGELTLFVDDDAVAEEKYIVLWKKEDGKWKLFRDIFNSNLPSE